MTKKDELLFFSALLCVLSERLKQSRQIDARNIVIDYCSLNYLILVPLLKIKRYG